MAQNYNFHMHQAMKPSKFEDLDLQGKSYEIQLNVRKFIMCTKGTCARVSINTINQRSIHILIDAQSMVG